MSNDCEKVSYTICGHTYQFWCKKDKIETANYIFDKISTIIEKNHTKNTGFSFDKVLFMSLIDMMVKEKVANNQASQQEQQNTNTNSSDDYNTSIENVIQMLKVIKGCLF